MKLLKTLLTSLALSAGILSAGHTQAQVISDHYFGENAWMPDTIGNANNCTDPPCILNGKLYQQWGNIRNSKASIIRFGGITPDRNRPTNYQYMRMIDSIRANGMEPIIQVPFYNYRYTAQQAANIVSYINIAQGKNIKYWIIGNEPNLGYGFTSASQIAAYIKPFASAMKAVDPSILIIGPEIAWFDQGIINGLTQPGGANDITGKDGAGRYYIDVISFHTYPFNGTQTRSQVITKLASQGGLQDNLAYLNTRVTACNSYHNRTGSAALKTAITELNVNYQNNAGDNLNGNGANSFIGGQFVAEMLGIGLKSGVDFINVWSVIEGNNTVNNIGYIDPSSGHKKPLYYHFQMMAENFKGNYAASSDNQANVKTFASKDGQQIAVLLMNQEQGTNLAYTVRLDNSAVNGNSALKVNVDAGLNKDYTGTIDKQSSMILLFDASGNITKRIEYKLNGNADANLPPTVINILAAPTASITAGGPTTFCQGGNVVLTANAGAGLTYQWKKAGADIAGATSQSYTANAAGSYTVAVTNAGGTTLSSPTVVTVDPTPVANITAGGPTSFCEGGSVTLTADAGQGYVYQWKKDNIALPGAVAASLTASDAGSYTVDVANAGGCNATSAAVVVTKSTPVASVTAGGPTSFCEGGSVTLTADAGQGYGYQWKKNNTAIAGATSISYTASDTGSYTVDVTNAAGCSAVSAAVTITRGSVPVATVAVDSSNACLVKLSAHAENGYSYQWKKDNINLAGATSSEYIASSAGTYSVEITNTCGSDTSAGIYIRDCAPTGVENTETAFAGLNVYPNPATSQFTIEMKNEKGENIEVVLISASGQEVYHGNFLFENGKEEIVVAEDVATGVYVLRMQNGKQVETRQMILQ